MKVNKKVIGISIFCVLVIVILVFVFIPKGGVEVNTTPTVDEDMVQLITKMDFDLDRLLDVDNGEYVGVVGDYDGETLYGFGNIPYTALMKNLGQYMSKEAIHKELIIRDFSWIKNNIVFLNNEETQKRFLLQKQKVENVFELERTSVETIFPELTQKLEDWSTKNYYDFRFYKSKISTLNVVTNKAEAEMLESVYVVARDINDKVIVLDIFYYLNGEKYEVDMKNKLNVKQLGYFEPYKFEKNNSLNLGAVDSIIERVENYQGSQPYTEQNLEENNKKFE